MTALRGVPLKASMYHPCRMMHRYVQRLSCRLGLIANAVSPRRRQCLLGGAADDTRITAEHGSSKRSAYNADRGSLSILPASPLLAAMPVLFFCYGRPGD
jgi:hypothetical protein